METLKNTVQSKTAVPTAQVYVSILQSNWLLFSWREPCKVMLQCYNIDWKFAVSNVQLFIQMCSGNFSKLRCSFDKFRFSFWSYTIPCRLGVFLPTFLGHIGKYWPLFCRIAQIQLHVSSFCSFLRRLFFCDFQPQFITLAHLWTGFQDEMVLLSVLSNILASLEPFTKVFVVLQWTISNSNFTFIYRMQSMQCQTKNGFRRL